MTKHNHKDSESHRHGKRDEGEWSSRKLHKDWRVWLVVGVMLVAIVMYVFTLDDSVVPSILRH